MTDDFRTYLFSYPHEGSHWSLEIMARNEADAKARLQMIANYGIYDGELIAKLPASVGWIARIVVAMRNLFAMEPR